MIRVVVTWAVILFICSVFLRGAIALYRRDIRDTPPQPVTPQPPKPVTRPMSPVDRETQARLDRAQLETLERRWRHPSNGR